MQNISYKLKINHISYHNVSKEKNNHNDNFNSIIIHHCFIKLYSFANYIQIPFLKGSLKKTRAFNCDLTEMGSIVRRQNF
ncbi:MAG: hypothetical protein ACI8TA_002561 [Cyclobacteriaceae bacterium]|jgi:hypothetical protein